MTFASPLWLAALLPWLAVALYLLWGRRRRWDVPFLELWRGPAAVEHAKWKVSAPPIALAMALLAMLWAILGAARPIGKLGAGGNATAISIVVDRGLTMSARGLGDLRFREAGRDAADEIATIFGSDVPIEAWIVPARGPDAADVGAAERFRSPNAWSRSLDHLSAAAIDTSEAVRQTAKRALAAGAGPVVVISDGIIGIEDPRIVEVTPKTPLRNAGIAVVSARASPRPQVMVRVRNDSPVASAALQVDFGNSGDAPVRRPIDLPPAGGERDYFFDARRLGSTVSATLIVPDDLEADNKAWAVRESAWPRVELSRPAGALSRLIDVYTRLHPSGDGARIVRVVGQENELAVGESGVVIEAGTGAVRVRPTRVVPHPITDAVPDWTSLELPAGDGKPPADFAPVLSAGDQTLVAVHEVPGPERRVWVGLNPAGWADRPEYVAFWAAALDWAGGTGSGERYASSTLDAFDPAWKPVPADSGTHNPGTWPGLYQRDDGARRAFNASPPGIAALAPADWGRKLYRLRSAGPGHRDLSALPMLAAMAFVLLAAATWRKVPARHRF